MSRRSAEPEPDDQTEVEDREVRTIVYDDVDGDVVERRQLPAPARPAASPPRLDAPVRREIAAPRADAPRGDVGARRVVAATVPAAVRDAAIPRPVQAAAPSNVAEPQPSRPMPAARRSPSVDPAEPVAVERGVVCPFCAHVRAADDAACPRCTMADTPSTRRSTGERIGPWFVLQRKNPTAPGLRFSVILALARRGHVTARSIVRGPTTGQLWRYAGEVKGLSRLFGVCWHCRGGVSPDAGACQKCRSAQEVPDDPDAFLESHAEATADAMMSTSPMSVEVPADFAPATPILEVPTPTANVPTPPLETPTAAPRQPIVSRAVAPAAPRPRPAHRPPRANGIDPMLSASELAAVFQIPSTDPPPAGVARRAARVTWRAARVGAVAALVVGAAVGGALYLKPEWREPTRAAVVPYATAARDAAGRAVAWTRETSSDAWRSAGATIARWRGTTAPNATPAVADATRPLDVAASDGAATPAPSAPGRAAEADAAPSAVASPPPAGTPSIVDVAPAPAAPSVAVARPIPPEQSWDAILGAQAAPTTTRPTVAAIASPAEPPASVAANPAAAEGAPPPPAAPVDAEQRAAQIDAAVNAAIADADRVLADAQQRVRRNGLPGEPTAAARPQQKPAAAPSPVTPSPVAPTPAPQPAPMSVDQAMNQAATLRQTAIDAEARRDWAAALKVWEQIAALPEAARPSDVKVRLQIAKDRVRR